MKYEYIGEYLDDFDIIKLYDLDYEEFEKDYFNDLPNFIEDKTGIMEGNIICPLLSHFCKKFNIDENKHFEGNLNSYNISLYFYKMIHDEFEIEDFIKKYEKLNMEETYKEIKNDFYDKFESVFQKIDL